MLPRLAGQWTHLERLGGGIGTRGPGETQIETDRQIIRTKIQKLKKALSDVSKHSNIYRKRRKTCPPRRGGRRCVFVAVSARGDVDPGDGLAS